MGDFEKHITADYLRKAAAALREINELSYSLMDLQHAASALDVGCGPGRDVVPMAKVIGAGGKITGLDISEEMLANALEYAKSEGVADKIEFVCGSAMNLPFADSIFDAVRAERLFQVLPQNQFPPAKVFAETVRVLKPNGMLVLIDMDWGSASVDFPDLKLERRFMEIFAQQTRPNGYAGRCFKRWMIESGFEGVTTHGFARVMENLDDCPLGAWLAEDVVMQGAATKEEAALWIDTLRERNAKGAFYACANMIVVAGRKVS
jgi:ubiquinone/menaquinone biosynthesis C-methylase UbiE